MSPGSLADEKFLGRLVEENQSIVANHNEESTILDKPFSKLFIRWQPQFSLIWIIDLVADMKRYAQFTETVLRQLEFGEGLGS